LNAACFRMETIEHFAHIAFVSSLIGKIHTLPEQEIDKLLEMRKKQGFPGSFKAESCVEQSNGVCSILEKGDQFVRSVEPEHKGGANTVDIPEETIRSIVQNLLKNIT